MVERGFVEAAKAGVTCVLVDHYGRQRSVEPYMVYRSSRGKRLFHCFRTTGYSKSGVREGWKNPEVADFSSITVTDIKFRQRPEYNPANTKMFIEVFFALPKWGGAGR
jgi:hypothetical protein